MASITVTSVQEVGAWTAPQSEAALSTVESNVEKLKRDLLCGIDPSALDPAIAAGIELVARIVGTANAKTGKEIAGMSLADLSKALMNAAKAVDGLARLRSFAAGGPDARPEAPQFVLQIVKPEEPADDKIRAS